MLSLPQQPETHMQDSDARMCFKISCEHKHVSMQLGTHELLQLASDLSKKEHIQHSF